MCDREYSRNDFHRKDNMPFTLGI